MFIMAQLCMFASSILLVRGVIGKLFDDCLDNRKFNILCGILFLIAGAIFIK
jgi:putative Ca2+/H+ antiporter (TMEM165/GDT1 family)